MTTSGDAETSYEIKSDDIKYLEQIGKGAFGTVFHVKLKTKDGLTVDAAAKRIEQSTQSNVELRYMSELKHKHIIAYYGFIRDETAITIITELATKGDLQRYLQTCDGPLSEELMKTWSTDAAEAIHYLHQRDIVHKDIKSSNFLITDENSLKLGDFGTVGDLDTTVETPHRQGTVRWMAPEVIEKKIRSKKSDTYSYGIVTWEICSKEVPFAKLETRIDIMEAIVAGKRPVIPPGCLVVLRKVMESCWQHDYQTRPTMEEVLGMLNSNEVEVHYQGGTEVNDSHVEEELPDRYEFFAKMVGDMQKTTRNMNEHQVKDKEIRLKFRAASKTTRDLQIKKAEASRESLKTILENTKPEERLKLLMEKQAEMIAAKEKSREGVRNTVVSMTEKSEAMDKQLDNTKHMMDAFAKQTTEQMFQSCNNSEEWDVDDLNTFTRMMTMHASLPEISNPSSSEFKTYDNPQSTSDVLSVSCIPDRHMLLEWKAQLEMRKTSDKCLYIEAGEERYDIEAIQQMITLHTALDTKSEVKQELEWFLSPPVTPTLVEKRAGSQKKFQDMVFHVRRGLVQDGFDMNAVQLSEICCDRILSFKHIQWILTRLNEMQSDVFCIYPRAEEDTQRNLCKLLEGNTAKPSALVFFFNVWRSEKNVFLEDDAHSGTHYTLCYVNALTNNVMYCDSLGWPMPADLQETISLYYQCIYGYMSDLEVFLAHEALVTDQGTHICSPRCATYYPLQKCASICGVVVILMASIACIHPNLFQFLTTIQRHTTYYAITFLTQPTENSKYLRCAVATWMSEGQIDLDYILPKNFDKYLLVSTFDPRRVVEMEVNCFMQLIVPVPGLSDLLFPDIPDSEHDCDADSDLRSSSKSRQGITRVRWKGTVLDDINQEDLASTSRITATRVILPNVSTPKESKIIHSKESIPITDLLKLSAIPDQSALQIWQQQLEETSEKLGKGDLAYVETEEARYDANAIRIGLDLHRMQYIKTKVDEELEWFAEYQLIPLAETKIPKVQSLNSFRNLIHTYRRDEILEEYSMDPDELAHICCNRHLSEKHIQWIMKTLNLMQSDVRCMYHESVESTLSKEKSCDSQTRPTFIVIIFNISKSGMILTGGNEDRSECRFTFCNIDVSSGKVMYGDPCGLPAPDNLQDVIATYYQHLIGLPLSSMEVFMCHDVTLNTPGNNHVCSPLCATYFPFQMSQLVSGVVCSLLAAIACLAPGYLDFLTSTQYNALYTASLALHMHYPGLHSQYLRRVLATWFVEKQIDVANIVPGGFDKHKSLAVSGSLPGAAIILPK